jgi:hypothetical protein
MQSGSAQIGSEDKEHICGAQIGEEGRAQRVGVSGRRGRWRLPQWCGR